MASSSVAISPTAQPDWRKMNKEALRDALASRGLDTNGLRPSLIQRLESSVKALAAAEALATSVADEPIKSSTETSEKESLTQIESHSEGETQTPNTNSTSLGIELQSEGETQTPNTNSTSLATKETLISTLQEDKVTQEPSDAKSSPLKLDVDQVKATAENGRSEHNVSNTHLSDLEKKRLRAERFGVGLQVSEKEKLALRAERFSGTEGKKSSTAREPESEKRKQRAARFGIVDDESRKKARQERFVPAASKQEKSSEVDKRKARAARFGAATETQEKK